MFATLTSSCIVGLDALPVDVEATVRQGTPKFTILGLGGAAIRESRDRIIAALEYNGIDNPGVVLVNLAPAEVKKESTAFDLPIALAIAAAIKVIPAQALSGISFYGELSLTGEVKATAGVTAHALCAAQYGIATVVVPYENRHEARVVEGVRVIGVHSFSHAVRLLTGREEPQDQHEFPLAPVRRSCKSLDDVHGQEAAKRALVIAAAGGHNMLMIGPPGCGKSMLAERLSSILPPLEKSELLEVLRIHSVAGLSTSSILSGERPYRAPHHVVSDAGLIGGGSGPRPGEVSLAHRGVLFLDEFPEYRRSAVEALRAPIEMGAVQVARARASIHFPARFQLVAAMNPCPCGRLGSHQGACRCAHYSVRDYLARLSQPILDRIDLHVELEAVPVDDLVWSKPKQSDGTADISQRVVQARQRQYARYRMLNNEASDALIKAHVTVTSAARTLLSLATQRLAMSARGYVRVLRVAVTIADLAGEAEITEEHVAEAVSYRSLDRLSQLIGNGAAFRRVSAVGG
jgi:magnesium chelatase family protein